MNEIYLVQRETQTQTSFLVTPLLVTGDYNTARKKMEEAKTEICKENNIDKTTQKKCYQDLKYKDWWEWTDGIVTEKVYVCTVDWD